jgi:hypothetical protein
MVHFVPKIYAHNKKYSYYKIWDGITWLRIKFSRLMPKIMYTFKTVKIKTNLEVLNDLPKVYYFNS